MQKKSAAVVRTDRNNFIFQIGEPEYLGKHECEHRFEWHTKLACNSIEPCVTIDSKTGFK